MIDMPIDKPTNKRQDQKEESRNNRDYRIMSKIKKAKELFERYGDKLKAEFSEDIEKLDFAIDKTWKYMNDFGIPNICRECAKSGNCCCKPWVAEHFDEYDILMNYLLGVDVPENREIDNLCFFVGKNGCKLKLRQVICVDFLCPEIEKKIGEKKTIKLREIEGEELEIAFKLKEDIKKKIFELENLN